MHSKTEICYKCGKKIGDEEQACVFAGEIICESCDTELRNPKKRHYTTMMVVCLLFGVIGIAALSWFLWIRFTPLTPKFIVQIKKTAFGKVGPKDEVLLSADGQRVAIIQPNQAWTSEVNTKGRRISVHSLSEDGEISVLTIDGIELGETGGTNISPTVFRFSPDGRRFMYEIRGGKSAYVTVDRTKGKEYAAVRELTFSPDSNHFAYCARIRDSEKDLWTVVMDGNEGPVYKKVSDLKFSNDGTKLAYRTLNDSGIAAMAVNGESGDSYKSVSAPAFFLNTGEVVYIGVYYNMKTMVVVVGETEEHPYEVIAKDSLRLDPTGMRFAYVAFRGDKLIVVADEKESQDYNEVSHMSFSNDGQSFAYRAKRNGRDVFVVDDVESKEYDEIRSGLFSPDGRRFAFVARRENKWLTVVDGIEGPKHENILRLVFSPDSKRIAYNAVRNDKCFVVVDGVEGEECDDIQNMLFSPDSMRFAYKMNTGRQPYPELTEDEQYISRTLMHNGKVVETPLPNEKGTERILRSMGKWLFVLDGVHGNKYESLSHQAFSLDSKHFAYWASDSDKSMVIVDGVCVLEGEGISLSDLNYTSRFYRWMDMPMPLELRNRFIFDSPTTFHTFAKYEGEVVRLDFTILAEDK